MLQAVRQDRLLDFGADSVGVPRLRARELVQQPLGLVHLVVPADLVELLPAVADHRARVARVPEVWSQL